MEIDESNFAGQGCGTLIKQINDAVAKRANNSLREKNLTLTQLRVLMELHGGGITPLKELERKLQVAQSSAAGVVSRLRTKGLVSTFTSPDDSRVKLAGLTPSGERYCRDTWRDIESIESRMFSGFSKAEKDALKKLLMKIYENLK
ncbi:MAG: MarR family winged helix-turn-helix transcriptional regulator [Oscillospiraceae bacterium]|jgi:DNA-binding MarR family transcriptional regulator|nr:MarR family winged helix-turn-helix transcriptional regulator [Oscillospiraceae bacterium]